MPGRLQSGFKLDVFYRRLIFFGTLLLVMVWGVTFFSLRQERQAAETTAEQTMKMLFRGSATRANDIFQDAYEYISLAQAADDMGVSFERLYENMTTGRSRVDAIDHVLLFDRASNLLYSSNQLQALPDSLANFPQNEALHYVVTNWDLNNSPEIFYIIGRTHSGNRIAVAVKSQAFAEYVRPSTLANLFQFSLVDFHNQIFSNWNINMTQLATIKQVRQTSEKEVFWELLPDGQSVVAASDALETAPFFLRVSLPEDRLLQQYYERRNQLLAINFVGSVLLAVLLFFAGRAVRARTEARNVLTEEKERFQQLVENLREVFFMYEAPRQGTIYISPSAEQLWGEPLDDSVDFALERIAAQLLPEDREKFAQARLALLQAEGKMDLECRIRRRDNQIRWIWVRASNLNRMPEPDWIVGVIEDITDRKRLELALRKMAKTDALTELANRAHFFEHGEVERYRATRYSHPLSVLMIDIDFFKQVNDTYGHAVGDQVLVMVTHTCRQLLRSTDLMARIGGEEFGVLLSETDLHAAEKLAKRLQTTIAAQQVEVDDGAVTVTLSIGVSQLKTEDNTFDTVLKRADAALYQAKQSGRNQVAIG